MSSRLGGGDKDKPAAPKGEQKSGGLGGLASRLPIGKGSDKPAASSAAKPASGSASGGIGSRLGGLTSRLPGRKEDDKKPVSSSGSSSSAYGSKPGSTSPSSSYGAKPSTPSSSSASGGDSSRSFLNRGGSGAGTATAKPGAASPARPGAKPGAGGNILSRFVPSFGQKGDKKTAAAKPRTSKAPRVQSEGLSLDSKLDILGVVLTLGSLVLFFSSLSPNKGQLTGAINDWIGQIFGWGALAIPAAMMVVGVWLIARHFGEEAPVVPTMRIIGIVMVYIGILMLMQYIDTFSYISPNNSPVDLASLRDVWLPIAIGRHSGGGMIGANLYYILASNITEYGAFFAMIGWLIVGIMFTLSISAAELAMIIISVGRSFGTARKQRATRRAAAMAALQAQQMTALPAAAPVLTIARPEVEALPAGSAPALPAVAEAAPAAAPERNIAIKMGGRSLSATNEPELVPVERKAPVPGAGAIGASPLQPARAEAAPSGGGIGGGLSRLRGALPSVPLPGGAKATDPKSTTPDKSADGNRPTPAGIRDRLFGGRGAKPETAPEVAASAATLSPAAPANGTPAIGGRPQTTPAMASAAAAPKAPAFDNKQPDAAPARLSDLMRPASETSKPTSPASGASSSAPARPAFGTPASANKSVPGGAMSSGSLSGAADRSPIGGRPLGSSAAPTPAMTSPFGKPASPLASSGRPLSIDDEDDEEEDEVMPTTKASAFGASAAPGVPSSPPRPAVPQKTAEELEAERLASLPPAKPRGTGPLPRQDETGSRFGATSFGAKPTNGDSANPADRQDRLNAIRSGNLADVKPEDAVGEKPLSPFAKPATANKSAVFDDENADEEDFIDIDDEGEEDDDEDTAAKGPARPASPFGVRPTPTSAAPLSSSGNGGARPYGAPATAASAAPSARPEGKEEPKSPQPAAAFWKSPGENAAATGLPPSPMVTQPPATSFGRPTQPPGVPEPPRATPVAASAVPEPVINTPRPAEPPPKSAGVGMSAPAGARRRKEWKLPNTSNLLMPGSEQDFDRESLLKRARLIEDTLNSFGAPGKVVEVNTGPVITQFGVEPDYLVARGGKKNRVKVGAIAQLDKDLQLALGAKSIRIEAPVPGKGYVGIEVPNEEASLVSLRDVMEANEFKKINSPLTIALGQSVDGTPIAADLASMPHLLIAGTTGSGKSVCVNAIITSILINNTPEQVKFIMVDPKRVELTGYNGIPHLVAPVVVELERIVGVLKWVTREMDERYKKFSSAGARNIEDYNKHLQEGMDQMPYIVVIIDELADLMMLAPDETERVITRIAALARATGIHLVIATQRPSVDVVTGLIKANFPARIAFAVAGGVDSRVILDQPGAEKLLGRGDMLYMSGDSPAPLRLQGVYVSDTEINNIVRYWRSQMSDDDVASRPINQLVLDNTVADSSRSVSQGNDRGERSTGQQQAFWDRDNSGPSSSVTSLPGSANGRDDQDGGGGQDDELYEEAVELVRRLNKASVSLLQRRLRIGYTRAARLIDVMEEQGIVGPATEGSKPREVLPLD
ncbi:MAG: DNA translocase FtsK [Chloroflexota bacterium]